MIKSPGQVEPFTTFVQAVAAADAAAVRRLLIAHPELARCKAQPANECFIKEIEHCLYGGDTPLHVAAAAYWEAVASQLMGNGADIRAKNRHGQEPLHYAALGTPGSQRWNPIAQTAMIRFLLKVGADPNCVDRGGVTPLHRAVRTRCAAAVRALLEGGADPTQVNKNGSTPIMLANLTTGRGGAGTPEAKAEQQEIIAALRKHSDAR
jgi:hypothetical protein